MSALLNVWNNYECEGQMSLYDCFTELLQKPFSWDDDINEIHQRLKTLVKKHGLSEGKIEWAVWSHVPKDGYRMTFAIVFTKENYGKEEVWAELDEIIKMAREREISLTPMATGFIGHEESCCVFIYSTFNDQYRKRIK